MGFAAQAGISYAKVEDGQYSLEIYFVADTWTVFCDTDRDNANEGGSEHIFFEGTDCRCFCLRCQWFFKNTQLFKNKVA